MYWFPLDFINYSFLLHAHSHVAMLGWVYLMIYVLVVHFFIPKEKRRKHVYNQLFWLTEFSVIGMMLAFPIQGYALFSIVFSTLHIVLSYVFCRLIWKDSDNEKTPVQKLLIAAMVFMVVSTVAVWCLGPAVSTLGKQSAFYQIAIQFFLHFQFNGWFLLSILALFLKQFQYKVDEKQFKKFYVLLIASVVLTVFFSVRWFIENDIFSLLNTFGVVLQLLAFAYGYKMLMPQINNFTAGLDPVTKVVYGLALFSLVLKISLQLMTVFPDISQVSHQIRNFVIGFIHLTSLGVITGFLLGILLQNKIISAGSSLLKTGITTFILGYCATEILLFLQGGLFYFEKGMITGYHEMVFGFSFLLFLGLLLIMASLINKKQEPIHS
jgi:hypothetical protein